jgi:gas vesicle protein
MARRYAREGDVIVEEDSKLGYFFLGLGLGAAIGVLFAPQSGEETRRLLKDKADEGVDILKKRTADLQETAAEALERSKQSIQRRKEALSGAVEAGRQAYREAAAADND